MPRKATPPHPRSVTGGDRALGLRIRQARIAIRISQQELGNALGVSFQQVQKYEKGVNRVGAERLKQIAKTLQVSTSYLLGENGGPNINAAQEELNNVDFNMARKYRALSADAKQAVLSLMNHMLKSGFGAEQ